MRAQELRAVTQRAPTLAELEDLMFAWRVAKYVKSNAIVCVKDRVTLGIGAGQMSRVVSSQNRRDEGPGRGLVARRRRRRVRCVLSVSRRSGRAGASSASRSIIQPGGSKRDAEVIAAADEHGIAMVFTGMRHFRH